MASRVENTTGAPAGASDVPCMPAPPPASPRLRLLCALTLAGVGMHFVWFGGSAVVKKGPDFEYFYKAGAWLYAHGTFDPGFDRLADGHTAPRGTIDWYLPFVHRLMTLLGWMPIKLAGWLWLIANVGMLAATLWLVARHLSGLPPTDWLVIATPAVLLGLLFWHWEFRLNQVNNLTLLLMVGGFVCWMRGRDLPAGLWLGLAALIKITPVLLLVWFALKRQYRVAAAGLATIALAGPVSDAVVLGPAQAFETNAAWFERAVTRSSHRGLVLHQVEMDWRNQGLGAVLSRWLHPTSYSLRFHNDPRIITEKPPAYVNVADLPLTTVVTIVTAVAGASLLGLLWLWRRPASRMTVWELRLEFALVLLAMLWFMPVMRRYHLVWTLPALTLLVSTAYYLWADRLWRGLALSGMAAVALGQLAALTRLLGTEIAEGAGVLLAALLALGVVLCVMVLRLARRPERLPADAFAVPRRPAQIPQTHTAAQTPPTPLAAEHV